MTWSANVTPLNPAFKEIKSWIDTEKTGFKSGVKKYCLSRIVTPLAIVALGSISFVYNAGSFTLKSPICITKYTIFMVIPVKVNGKWCALGSCVPNAFGIKEMAKHGIKAIAFLVEVVVCPVIGFVSPTFIIWLNVKCGLVDLALDAPLPVGVEEQVPRQEEIPEQTQPTVAPPAPPAPTPPIAPPVLPNRRPLPNIPPRTQNTTPETHANRTTNSQVSHDQQEDLRAALRNGLRRVNTQGGIGGDCPITDTRVVRNTTVSTTQSPTPEVDNSTLTPLERTIRNHGGRANSTQLAYARRSSSSAETVSSPQGDATPAPSTSPHRNTTPTTSTSNNVVHNDEDWDTNAVEENDFDVSEAMMRVRNIITAHSNAL